MTGDSANHPANTGLRRYLEPRMRAGFPARLWRGLGKPLPEDCRAVFFGTPALIHPVSGIVFAFAAARMRLSLPLPDRAGALEAERRA